jgi:hypothetical protein
MGSPCPADPRLDHVANETSPRWIAVDREQEGHSFREPRSSAVARTTASTASLERSGGVKVPLLYLRLQAPDKGSLAWYEGLGG